MSKSPTPSQVEQRQLAWLLYVALGAAGNLAAARGRFVLSPPNRRQARLNRRVDAALNSLNELSFELHDLLSSIPPTKTK